MAALPETLQTPRLRLHLLQPSDATAVFEIASDAEVARFMPWPRQETMAEADRFVQERIDLRQADRCRHWLIRQEAADSAVGLIGLGFEDADAEVGFVIRRSRWGEGFATEALGAVLAAALADPSIHRVWGWCDAEHAASARVMEKAGMALQAEVKAYRALPAFGPEPRDALIYTKAR